MYEQEGPDSAIVTVTLRLRKGPGVISPAATGLLPGLLGFLLEVVVCLDQPSNYLGSRLEERFSLRIVDFVNIFPGILHHVGQH